MPKIEEPVPWALSEGAEHEPYPRKNVYFSGEELEEVYDYCVWRTQVTGYDMFGGGQALGVSKMLKDLVVRDYLKTMLDDIEAKKFREWRRAAFVAAGADPKAAATSPGKLIAAHGKRAKRGPYRPKRAERLPAE
jgi:hypothetical protein